MKQLFQDLRFGLRQLRKNPAFTAVAVITLALGIGANTAIFTVVNALLLKSLPVKDPQQLVVVGSPTLVNGVSNGTPRIDIFSYPLYRELRDRNSVFSGLSAAANERRLQVGTGQGSPLDEKVTGRMVSGNYFSVLGLEPAAGRLISDSDDTAENANPVVVLGYDYWQRKFALSPAIIGSEIRLNDAPFTVIGVAPAGFEGDVVGERMALYVPLSMQPEIVRGRHWRNAPNTSWLSLIGRLKPGITAIQAEAELNVIFQQVQKGDFGARLSSDDRNEIRNLHINVSAGGTGLSELRRDYRIPLLLLMGIVGLVLLIACVNVANLLLARAAARGREIAVRLAIGAHRGRLVQQLLTESILLALIGGVAGSLLAVFGVRLLVQILGSNVDLPLSPDARLLAFTIVVSLFTGVLFGVVPALKTLGVSVTPTLKEASRSTRGSGSGFGWGKGLIAAQVALSLLVLFAATLLVRSLQNLMTQNFGYNRDRLVIARVDPIAAGYSIDGMRRLATEITSRLASVGELRAVTYSENGLFGGTESNDALIIPGHATDDIKNRSAYEDFVGADYFGVVGIPVLAGRGIEAQDTATSTRVVVVNEAMVKRFFAGQNPIGRQFKIDDQDWLDKPLTVIGVSANAKDHGWNLREEVAPRFYLAFQQSAYTSLVFEAQASGGPSAAITDIRNGIQSVDPHLPINFIRVLDSLVSDSAANQILLARISTFFAGLALLLACVGLYGVMSYTVAGRTREIGVRMALGARRGDVMEMVLREAMVLVAIGLLFGIPLALTVSQTLHGFLFGLKSSDPLSLSAVVLVLAIVAALAGCIPARRAAKVDPMVALRYE